MKYVLCFVQDGFYTLVLEKVRPEWQKGRLNLPGGKIEPGETPEEAAVRELYEETGLETDVCETMGEIEGPDWHITVVKCYPIDYNIQQREEERPDWLEHVHDRRLMNNLRVIIPILHAEVRGWKLVYADESPTKFTMELPCLT